MESFDESATRIRLSIFCEADCAKRLEAPTINKRKTLKRPFIGLLIDIPKVHKKSKPHRLTWGFKAANAPQFTCGLKITWLVSYISNFIVQRCFRIKAKSIRQLTYSLFVVCGLKDDIITFKPINS